MEPFDNTERQLARTLGSEIRRLRERKHLTQAALARKAGHYSRSTIATLETGWGKCSLKLVEGCDEVLGAGGALVNIFFELKKAKAKGSVNGSAERRKVAPTCGDRVSVGGAVPRDAGQGPRVLQALEVTRCPTERFPDRLYLDGLTDLVSHYAWTVRKTPPLDLYDEVLSVRAHAGYLLESPSIAGSRLDLIVTVGWMSILLAVVAHDLGDHAAALVWCTDAERRSEEAGMPELAGWAADTRVLMAFYKGQAREAVAHARKGQTLAVSGTVAHAKLVAHEMRAWAALRDPRAVDDARRRAEIAIAKLPADAPKQGPFSISVAHDPPYTATSLVLLHRFQEAEGMARQVIAAYVDPAQDDGPRERPSAFARAHLVHALALTGLGRLEEAHRAGTSALNTPRLDWPTAVLASQLDRALMHSFEESALAADYRERWRMRLDQTRIMPPAGSGWTQSPPGRSS